MRPTRSSIFLTLAGFSACSVLAAGCNESSSKSGHNFLSGGTAAAGVTSDAIFGGSGGLPPSAPGAEFLGPNVEIVSPARGAYLPAGPTAVEAKVLDNGAGVAEVHVNGMSTTVEADGTVKATVDLTPGLNTIVVESWDTNQPANRTERHVSVMAGQTASETAMVPEAATVRLGEDALDLVQPGIDQGIEAQRAAIVQSVLTTAPPKDTKFKSFSYGQASSDVDATPGGLRFRIAVSDLALGIEVKAKFLFFFKKTKKGTVRAQQMLIDGVADVSVANGQVSSTVKNVTVSLTGFSVPDWASKGKGQIESAFKNAFQSQAQGQLDKALKDTLAGAKTSGTISKTALGKTLELDWSLSSVTFDDDGANASFAAKITTPNPTYGTQDQTLVTRSPLVSLTGPVGPTWNGALAVHQDLLNQALHAVWRTGALQFDLDQAYLDKVAPLSPFKLTSDALIATAPALAQIMPAGIPIRLEVEAKLPPVVTMKPGSGYLADLSAGGIHVKVVLDDTANGRSTVLADAIYCVRAELDLREENGAIKLDMTNRQVEVRVDVTGKALPQSEPLLEQWSKDAAPDLVRAAISSMGAIKLPVIRGMTFANLDFQPATDALVISGRVLKAAAQTQNP